MDRIFTIPTFLTLLRLFIIPCALLSYEKESYGLALLFFIVGVCSDTLDGYIARTFNQMSKVGAALDPLVDKCVIIISYLFFLQYEPSIFSLFFVRAIFVKEILLVLGAIGLYFYTKLHNQKFPLIQPAWQGKWAMAIQCILLTSIFFKPFIAIPLFFFYFLIILSLFLSYYALFAYAKKISMFLKRDIL